MKVNAQSTVEEFARVLAEDHVLVINRNKKYVQVRYDMSDLQWQPRPKRKRLPKAA